MRFSILWGVALLAASVSAAPHGIATFDYGALLLAANLELLELNLWIQGLANYSSEFASFGQGVNYETYTEIHRLQEVAHFGEINSLLYGEGPHNCSYHFPGVHDAASFNKMAQVVTSVGSAAYLGAGANFTNKDYAAITSQILGSETRQNSFLRLNAKLNFYTGNFDTPLSGAQAYSLAAPMIKNCPSSNPKLPFKQFPSFNATFASGNSTGKPGDQVKLVYPAAVDTTSSAALVVSQTKTYRAQLKTASDKKSATFTLPAGVTNGTAFVIASTAEGTPFPVPDSSVKAIGALVIN